MNEATNKQVTKTREIVCSALMELMNQFQFREIKISAITKQAGIARITFYRNFGTKEDIIRIYLRQLYRDLFNMRKKQDNLTIAQMIHMMFMITELQKPVLRKLFAHDLEYLVMEEFIEMIEEGLSEVFTDVDIAEYLIQFQIGGFTKIILNWVKEDCEKNATHFCNQITNLMNHYQLNTKNY
ncbi:TetR/AcrR family transcriptional regulator [Cytobacillus kochii]|uniref:TetR/AcrR family transcriptional regulator n=1 Tax=Cytobacillus kochii TaxID=859143 RepID=UPI001CD7EAC8|nr:TetR/AcrR family transcriptional regulator [Cytobacillus kochii]MCA1026536.1 TetR/AcrR family transcriptional regulator [Cytobacillus kochii]